MIFLKSELKRSGLDAMLVSYGNNVRYLSGFKGTAGELFVTADKAYLITDFRYLTQAKEQTGDIEIIDIAEGENEIYKRLCNKHNVQVLGFEGMHTNYACFLKLADIFKGIKLVSVEQLVENLRLVKNEDETNMLKKSCKTADNAFEKVLPSIKVGMTELEIAAMLEYEMKRCGASGTSFETIVASGKRSAMPHGTATTKRIENGDFVVMDFGCIYGGYCSDITRTVAVGNVSDKQRDIYNKVLTVQEECLKLIKPGEMAKNIDLSARKMFKIWEIDRFFGHSLGHGVGLDIHELPTLSSKSPYILEKGMIVTDEPGIYIENEFGVRIEDTVAVTENGCERLTTSSKELYMCK